MKRKWYASPYVVWMLLFTIVPLIFIGYYAFTGADGSFTMMNFQRIVRKSYLSRYADSFRLAFYCTILCLIVGYPTAYFLASKDFSHRKMLLLMIILPMWMNFLLRTYAMMTILENNGLLNSLLTKLGLGTVQLIGTEGAVLLGMVYNFLPFMVLPIYTALKKLDAGVIEAAEDLGANPMRVITRVVVPQSIPGVISGITMVFMPAVTTFAIPRLLSNGTVYLVGDMIEEYFITMNNRPIGSSISMVMLVVMLVSMGFLRMVNPDRNQKGGSVW